MNEFWSKVDASGDCWLWTAGKNGREYGVAWINRRPIVAHRYAYTALVGPVPKGLQLDHLCRVKACVNPDHLEPVTQRVNILRSHSSAAMNARKTHCPSGHPYSGENLRVVTGPTPNRKCWECDRIAHRRPAA